MRRVLTLCIKTMHQGIEKLIHSHSRHCTLPQDVADLIGQCLRSDPRQRPTAAEVLRRLRGSGGGEVDSCGT